MAIFWFSVGAVLFLGGLSSLMRSEEQMAVSAVMGAVAAICLGALIRHARIGGWGAVLVSALFALLALLATAWGAPVR